MTSMTTASRSGAVFNNTISSNISRVEVLHARSRLTARATSSAPHGPTLPSSVLLGLLLLAGCPGVPDEKPSPDTGDCTPTTWYLDADGDGFGDPGASQEACEPPEHAVTDAADCDDASPEVYPGAEEICGDGLINDCDDTDGSAAAAACPAGGPFELSLASGKLLGEGEDHYAGWSVAGAGDVNGDGYDDVLVGAPYAGGGVAYRVLGPVFGTASLGDANTRVTGGGVAGWVVANAGDHDGDGLPDALLGTPFAGSDDQGGAVIVSGSAEGGLSLADADAILSGRSTVDFAGRSVAGAGDVDGDGWDDILVGAPIADGPDIESSLGHCADDDLDEFGYEHGVTAGEVYLMSGPVSGDVSLSVSTAMLYGEDGGDGAGSVVAGPGDINADGVPDLMVSSVGQCQGAAAGGAVYGVFGPVEGELSLVDADLKAFGETPRVFAGEASAGAGDVNGDGYADLVVGVPRMWGTEGDLQGVAYLVLGPGSGAGDLGSADARRWGEAQGDYAGHAVAAAGDVDLDGQDDLLVAADSESTGGGNAGAAYLIYGPLSGTASLSSADIKFVGSERGDRVGASVAGAVDLDADGLADLLIGATGDEEAASEAGAVSLILGSNPMLTGGYGP